MKVNYILNIKWWATSHNFKVQQFSSVQSSTELILQWVWLCTKSEMFSVTRSVTKWESSVIVNTSSPFAIVGWSYQNTDFTLFFTFPFVLWCVKNVDFSGDPVLLWWSGPARSCRVTHQIDQDSRHHHACKSRGFVQYNFEIEIDIECSVVWLTRPRRPETLWATTGEQVSS